MIKQHGGRPKVKNQGRTNSWNGANGAKISGVVVGLLVGLDHVGIPLVDFPNNKNGFVPARATASLSKKHVGREVALMFEEGDPGRPLIIGVLQNPESAIAAAKPIHASVDGETVTITAEKEIVLRCGKASLMLTQDGKVTIRGTYLLSRSSGANRIQGGSIELN